jgi:hypothetical protein
LIIKACKSRLQVLFPLHTPILLMDVSDQVQPDAYADPLFPPGYDVRPFKTLLIPLP